MKVESESESKRRRLMKNGPNTGEGQETCAGGFWTGVLDYDVVWKEGARKTPASAIVIHRTVCRVICCHPKKCYC